MGKKRPKKRLVKKRFREAIIKEFRKIDPSIKVKFLTMNNKSRKGNYVLVDDGVKKGNYKIKETRDKEFYTKTFKENKIRELRKRHGKGVEDRRRKYYKKIAKEGSINSWLQKGIGEAEINNPQRMDSATIKNAYKTAFMGIIKKGHKDKIEILSREENVSKMRDRLEIIVDFQGTGNTLAKFSVIGKTLHELRENLRKVSTHKELWRSDLESLERKGFTLTEEENLTRESGKPMIKEVKSVRIRINVRKGR